MVIHKFLRTYRFLDKDPVIDELRTLIQDEGLFQKLNQVATLTNLSPSTLYNLFHGGTRRPQNATVMAITTALGYERKWIKAQQLNIEDELKVAKTWNKRERKRQEEAREKEKPQRKRKAA